MGEKREKERNTGRVVLLELLLVSDLSLNMLALKLYVPSQSGKHTKTTWQCPFFIFCLNFSFSFSLSLSVVADYDVHSLLSAWLRLASNQWPALHCHSPCSRSPDHSSAHHCVFFHQQWPASSCLLFEFLLTPDKQNLTSVFGVGQSAQFTFNIQQTWIRRENVVFYLTNEKFFSYIMFAAQTQKKESNLLWGRSFLFCFFVTVIVVGALSFHFVKPSHYFGILFHLICIVSSKEAPTDWLGSVITFVIILIPTAS